MKPNRIILIDADVVSHFIVGEEILYLPKIFPFPIKILDKVYAELQRFKKKKTHVDNLIEYKLLELLPFPEDNPEIKKEYFSIKSLQFRGDGESACMAVAKYQNHILASSNLKDIKHYCSLHGIDYLTTMDFLCEAKDSGLFSIQRCNDFISKVLSSCGKLPHRSMEEHQCRKLDFYKG